jgi:hypothetical protein
MSLGNSIGRWVRARVLAIIVVMLVGFSCIGALQALLLPMTAGWSLRYGRYRGYFGFESSNIAQLSGTFVYGKDPNAGSNDRFSSDFDVGLDDRWLADIPLLPSFRLTHGAGIFGDSGVDLDVPYVDTLLLGCALECLRRRMRDRRRRGFAVVTRDGA